MQENLWLVARRGILFAFVGCVFLLESCATKSEESYSPKVSPDARYSITLVSDKDQTNYYIDGQFIAKGKLVKAVINNGPHDITAQPDGYISKKEHIEPPYRDGLNVQFFFLIEDQLNQ